jgi:RHS repeat-associated protein
MTRQNRTSARAAKSLPVAFRVVCFIFLTLAAPAVRAQAPTDNGAPLGLAPGSPEGSYALSGFEDVSLYNGGLSFSFPLAQVGGRGGAGYTAHVPIDAKWMVVRNEWYDANDNLITALVPTPSSGGYTAGYGPGVISVRYSQWKPEGCYIGAQYFTTYRWASVSIVFTAPDGTEHEMVDQATLGSPVSYPSCSLNGNFRGPVFVSREDPGMTFIADAAIREAPYWGNGRVTGYLKMPDGTVYRLDSIDHTYQWGSYYELIISWVRDANGNKTTFNYTDNGYGARLTSVKDSLNHQITIEYGLNLPTYGVCDRLTYKGFDGAERKVHVSYGSLSTALRSGQTIKTYKQLFPELDGTEDTHEPSVTTAIWLPDSDGVTRRYKFLYDSYGELARVELPTGGAVEYDWASGLANGAASGVVQPVPNAVHWSDSLNLPQIYRRLVARRSYDTGNVLLGSTGYARPETQNYDNTISNAGYVSVGHYDANGQLLSAEAHYFYGSPATSLFTWQASPQNMPAYSPYPSYLDGREYQSDLLAANGSTLLRRTTQSWGQNSLSWWYGSEDSSPANRPYLKETVTTLADSGQVTKTTNVNPQTGQVMIDQFGNPLDVWVYDYGQGQPGPLLRHTHTDFLTLNPVNGVDYTNRTSASSPHRLNLPTRMSVYDGSEVERARTTMEYDNYNADANHAGLVDRPSISGFDSSFGTYYSTRGNATATTRYLLNNGSVTGSITGYAQYDIAGNTVKTIDARGGVETFDYTDRFGSPDGDALSNTVPAELAAAGQYSYGFATSTTNVAGQTTYTQYDYYLTKAVDTQDVNGTVFSGYFNDALDRTTQVVSAANRDASVKARAVFGYDDVNHVTTQTSDFNSFAESSPLKSQTIYDGVGRTTESRRYEGGSNYIAVRKRYDALGRASQVSNPFRNGETPIWTTTNYDELSRVTSVTAPDNSVSTTSYSGSSVTVTDPMGKKQKTVSDALGRVTQVYEDPNGANWLTGYAYDTLDNLTGVSQYDPVSQVTQTRTFVYDSLKRLVSSTNPESGTVGYVYDALGNLLVKTDARGVSTHVSYDALGRVTRRWYNGSSSTTATVNNSPAVPSGVAVSDEVNMFYDSQALPAGSPPGFSRGYATGRLVAVTYGGGSAGDYFGFDAMGRATVKVQQTGGVNYQTGSTYNNGGARKTLTYPSGHVVNYNYDAAGRLGDKDASNLAMTGNLGDGVTRTYSAGIAYSPFGGVSQERYGTQTPVYNKSFYNVRGQLTEMRVATTPNDTFWNRGAIINHYSDQSWAGSGPDNNGSLKKQDVYIPNDDAITGYSLTTSFYYYDGLNRVDWTREVRNGSNSFAQDYDYDRFGNRKVNPTNTSGVGATQFAVSPSNNRLGVPTGYYGAMDYDAAGNLTNDTYTGQGQRKYDASNRMTQAWAGGQWQTYIYDGNGRRVRRNVNGQETWQVYGIGGELLAEYAANASPTSPKKEHGYRAGELLVTAEPTQGSADIYRASTDFSNVQGQRNWYYLDSNGAQMTFDSANSWWRGAETYNVIWASGEHPGNAADAVRQWRSPGSGSVRITGSAADANTVCGDGVVVTIRKGTQVLWQQTVNNGDTTGLSYDITTAVASGDQINFVVNKRGENGCDSTNFDPTIAYTPLAGTYRASADFSNVQGQRGWYYLDSNGAQMTFDAGNNWWRGAETYNVIWADGEHPGSASDAVRRWVAPVGGTVRITGGASDANAVCGDGVSVTISKGAQVLWQQIISNGNTTGFSYDLTTIVAAGDQISFAVNKRAENGCDSTNFDPTITYTGGGSALRVNWFVMDQLGTPRMVVDQTGTLSGVSRHDYLPFGEELYAGFGGRTTTQGYIQSDGARQHFTGYERDDETGLDYAQARYYASAQGRFTGVDPVSGVVGNPQTWNAYTYTLNNPVNLTDPTGMFAGADQSGPSWEVEGYPDWWKRRALWTDEMARAMSAYDQMVTQGRENLKKRRQQKKQQPQPQQPQQPQQQQPPPPQVVDVRKDKKIMAQVDQIAKNGKPLQGQAPVLTSIVVVPGETYQINNGAIVDAEGTQFPWDGVLQPVAYVPLDQNGNIMPSTEVGVVERYSTNGGPAVQDPPSGLRQMPSGGVFIDMQAIKTGTPVLTVKQNVMIVQPSTRIAYNTGVNTIVQTAPQGNTPGSISLTIGPTKRRQ